MRPWELGLSAMIYGAVLGSWITYIYMITWFKIICPEKIIL